MVQTLEAIKGGGGSIKIGTTGTISALMTRELDSAKHVSKLQLSCTSSDLPTEETNSRKPKPKTSADEASSSSSSVVKNHKSAETPRKSKQHSGNTHQIPMLTARDVSIDGTPIRKKTTRRGSSMVEIVDIKCGNPDKTWVNPITNRLKKLGFSKLSESIM